MVADWKEHQWTIFKVLLSGEFVGSPVVRTLYFHCGRCGFVPWSPWNSPGQNTGVGSLSLLQGILPTQALNPCLPHCRQILYQLIHKGSPRTLEWLVYPFSSISSKPWNWTRVSYIAGGLLTNWAIREAQIKTRKL